MTLAWGSPVLQRRGWPDPSKIKLSRGGFSSPMVLQETEFIQPYTVPGRDGKQRAAAPGSPATAACPPRQLPHAVPASQTAVFQRCVPCPPSALRPPRKRQ